MKHQKGDIHTQVAMLNVNMMLKSETPTPPFNIKCGNKYSFVLKEDKKSYFLSYNEYQETFKEHHFYNDKVAINIVLNIIKHE